MWDTNWSRAHFIENHIVHQITAPNQFHRCSSCRRWSESLGTRDSIKYIPTLGMYSPDSFNILECHLDRMQFASAKLRFRSIATTLQWNAYYIHNNPHNTIIIIVHMPYIGFGMRSKPVSSLTILAIYHFVWYTAISRSVYISTSKSVLQCARRTDTHQRTDANQPNLIDAFR